MSWWAGSEIPLSSTPGICGYLQNTWQMLDSEICLISQCSLMYLINMQSKTSEDTAKTAARWVLWMHKTFIKIKKKNQDTFSRPHRPFWSLLLLLQSQKSKSGAACVGRQQAPYRALGSALLKYLVICNLLPVPGTCPGRGAGRHKQQDSSERGAERIC